MVKEKAPLHVRLTVKKANCAALLDNKSSQRCHSHYILAEGAIALSVTLSGGALFKFDRQGHSCNFYAGFGPTQINCRRGVGGQFGALLFDGRLSPEQVFHWVAQREVF